MRLEASTWLVTLLAAVVSADVGGSLLQGAGSSSFPGSHGSGKEQGRLGAKLSHQNYRNTLRDRAGLNKDSNRFDGKENSQARWAGKTSLSDNALAQNQQALRSNAYLANQKFGNFRNNLDDVFKQSRDEGIKNRYVVKDDTQYHRENENAAQGGQKQKANKASYDEIDDHEQKIRYNFNKVYSKGSNEEGAYEDENSRHYKNLNEHDEREKDRQLKLGDSEVSRSSHDERKAAKDELWKASADQSQAQDAKYDFADQRNDKAAERADERNLNYQRQDSKVSEEEKGLDEARRSAQDAAKQYAGYVNNAAANADSTRQHNDKKYYEGNANTKPETGYHEAGGAYYGDTAPVVGSSGTSRAEGTGGHIESGFAENAKQAEQAKEEASAQASSNAEAVNLYNRQKDKQAFDRTQGLTDTAKGQYKEDAQAATSRGASSNNAEAAKSAQEWDQKKAASSVKTDQTAKEKSQNEALRDRTYYLKKRQDDSEVFANKKQFVHKKNEFGKNDEKLNFDHKKTNRKAGTAENADLYKESSFKDLHRNGKVARQNRDFEDSINRRNQLHAQREAKKSEQQGYNQKQSQDQQEARARDSGYDSSKGKTASDLSESNEYNQQQSLHDQEDKDKLQAQDQSQAGQNSQADIEYYRRTNGQPLGDLSSGRYISPELLQPHVSQKGQKDYDLPDIRVNVNVPKTQAKPQRETQKRRIPSLRPVDQVKTATPVKHNKDQVSYDTHVPEFQSFRPTFSRINNKKSLFHGPRTSLFNRNQDDSKSQSRLGLSSLSRNRGPATSQFSTGSLLSGYGR